MFAELLAQAVATYKSPRTGARMAIETFDTFERIAIIFGLSISATLGGAAIWAALTGASLTAGAGVIGFLVTTLLIQGVGLAVSVALVLGVGLVAARKGDRRDEVLVLVLDVLHGPFSWLTVWLDAAAPKRR